MQLEIRGILISILEAIDFIVADTLGATFERFVTDRRMRQLSERNIAVVGKALIRLRRKEPELASKVSGLQGIIGLRNALAHGYDTIDNEQVWRAIQSNLPILRREVEVLLASGPSSESGG